MADSSSQFVFILGPTASGKSQLALQLAEKLNWPIINCDSIQVYQSLDIGSAKPSPEERKTFPHYLFDYVEAGKKLNAADYIEDVLKTLGTKKINQALFVGGSGFYIQALEKGLYPNSKVKPEIKKQVEDWIAEKGFQDLYQWIVSQDPEFSEKISANDHYRIRRAVEVMKSQDLKMSDLKKEMEASAISPLPPHQRLKIGLKLEKEELRTRVEARTQKMLDQGFIEEVQELRSQGHSEWAPMQSVGYKEVQLFLDGQLPKAELFERICISNMQLIKKQMTWFKRDSEIQWFAPDELEQASKSVIEWSKRH